MKLQEELQTSVKLTDLTFQTSVKLTDLTFQTSVKLIDLTFQTSVKLTDLTFQTSVKLTDLTFQTSVKLTDLTFQTSVKLSEPADIKFCAKCKMPATNACGPCEGLTFYCGSTCQVTVFNDWFLLELGRL